MSPSVDTPPVAAITDVASSDTSCSVPLTTSAANDICSEAVIPTNSLTEEKETMSLLESDATESEKEVAGTSQETTSEDTTEPSEKKAEGSEETPEGSVPTQQNETLEENVVPKEEEIEASKEEETTAEDATEKAKEEAGEQKDPEDPEAKPSNPEEDDIEWLTPFTLPKVKSGEELAAEEDAASATSGRDNPLKMLKKGAVAAVGGSMVGLGLVMIPLPTPFGAVVASSGLAVLGTEFKEAKDLNDSLIDGAKGHLNKARDSIVKGIEKMNEEDIDDVEIPDISNNSTIQSKDSSVETEENEGGTVIKMTAAKTLKRGDSNADSSIATEGENSEGGSASEPPPVWLHMNPIERQRQERLAKQKYRRDRQTSYEQAKEAMTKRTGKFLSKTILPFIKKAEPAAEVVAEPEVAKEEQVAETVEEATTTTTPKAEGESDKTAEKGEEVQTQEKETAAEVKTKEGEEAITTTENESEGYVVVS